MGSLLEWGGSWQLAVDGWQKGLSSSLSTINRQPSTTLHRVEQAVQQTSDLVEAALKRLEILQISKSVCDDQLCFYFGQRAFGVAEEFGGTRRG